MQFTVNMVIICVRFETKIFHVEGSAVIQARTMLESHHRVQSNLFIFNFRFLFSFC